MAKGQVRSNREVRKPKKDKQAAKVESTFANQMKTATKTAPAGQCSKEIGPLVEPPAPPPCA
ncbi:hypothetical protein A4U53_026345 [Rhizobium ruizarguesonis]|uniref:Uncharacterized protein n=1 Tax=Rhizobium ruizarguesonis TaxID=2081791 RepID=A0ACD5EKN2_9HYPH